jgi:hypothetical protein
MKNTESMKPLIGVGTILEISGHQGIVKSITREGVECCVANHMVVLDFDKITAALQNPELNNI